MMSPIKLTIEDPAVDDIEIETRSGRLHTVSIEASWDIGEFVRAINGENGSAAVLELLHDLIADLDAVEQDTLLTMLRDSDTVPWEDTDG